MLLLPGDSLLQMVVIDPSVVMVMAVFGMVGERCCLGVV